jgi:acetyl-CoA carboxylase biotin carboxyl carrier protein
MAERARDGRVYQPERTAMAKVQSDGRIEVQAPAVGLWRAGPTPGTVVLGGGSLGELEVLGVVHRLWAPAEARGAVVERPDGEKNASVAVGYGDPLVVLDPEAAGETGAGPVAGAADAVQSEHGRLFRAPTSGRFYGRPSPDKPPFVQAGDPLGAGQTLGLIEVMKTFNRITYPGSQQGLPEQARVVRVIPNDGDDVASGDPLLEFEPVG